MGLKAGEQVTIKPDARKPYVLAFQYHAEVTRHTDRGYYLKTGGTFEVDGQGMPLRDALGNPLPAEFGPFRDDQLDHGWRDSKGNWRT